MNQNNKNKGVVSLIFIYGIGLFALAITLTLTMGILTELIKGRNTISGDRSFYTAESATREGVYQYLNSGSVSGSLHESINNIDTSLTSFSINPSPRGWAYREVEGNAKNNLTNRTVNTTLLLFPAGAAFDYAVYSESDLVIKGNTTINGNAYSNGDIKCIGNPNIQGGAYSSASLSDSCASNATSLNSNIDDVPPPEIDPNYYLGIAACISDSANVKDDCFSESATGVVFVDDAMHGTNLQSIDLNGNLTIIGNLSLTGGSSINASNDYAAIVVIGNLFVAGNNTINGLVYVSGNTTFGNGDTTINGCLISKGGTETDISGNVTITYHSLSAPPRGISMSGEPMIIGWSEK